MIELWVSPSIGSAHRQGSDDLTCSTAKQRESTHNELTSLMWITTKQLASPRIENTFKYEYTYANPHPSPHPSHYPNPL